MPDLAFGQRGMLLGLLIYKRALSNAEINQVVGYHRTIYGTEWEDLV